MRSLIVLSVILGVSRAIQQACNYCECENHILNCAKQGLNIVPRFTASDIAGLSGIRYDQNQIIRVPKFPPLPIWNLSLASNRIYRIDHSAFTNLDNLTVLDVSGNQLTPEMIPRAFRDDSRIEGLKNLKILNLAHNNLHYLPANAFEYVSNLELLALTGNPLKFILQPTVAALTSVPYLKILDLSHTLISHLPHDIPHTLQNLEILNLSYNSFAQLPESLAHSSSLKHLILDGNPILSISQFPRLSQLQSLHLSYMPELREIGKNALGELSSLKEFYCSRNKKLKYIHSEALTSNTTSCRCKTILQLKKLHLNDNALRTIDRALIADWEHVDDLRLDGNTWMCDCENQWLVSTIVPIINATNPTTLKSYRCAHPVEMSGIKLSLLYETSSHMRCLDIYGNQPEFDGARLLTALAVVLLCVPFVMLAMLRYKMNKKQQKIQNYNETAPKFESGAIYKPCQYKYVHL